MDKRININADMGESFGAWTMGNDAALLQIVRSANIACGFHAGDPQHMSQTLTLAAAAGVSVGAHPSFADLQGFGRRPMKLSNKELAAIVAYQLGALQALALANGTRVTHLKPHGAMSNLSCNDIEMATVIAQTVARVDKSLVLLAPACSCLAQAGQAAGLRVALEVFADRAYQDDGQLVPRSQPHAMVHGASESTQHVLAMLEAGGIVTYTGQVLPTEIHSICVHGDNPHAIDSAMALRDALVENGYAVTPLDQLV